MFVVPINIFYMFQLSLIEKKNQEQEEKRRKEAEERTQKHSEDKANNDRLQKMTDIVKMKVQSKPTSKVQCIDPLPLPPSEMKKNRRVSDDRRSSTDSEGTSAHKEKNADKSLEKVSPLGTLYGEMPQPAKLSVFRIPKKPQPKRSPAKRSPSPPKSQRSPSPQSPSSGSEEEMDDAPALRYDSSEEEVEKPKEKKVAKPDSTPTSTTTTTKDSDPSPLSKEFLAEAIRSTLMSMGYNRPDEKKTEETAVKKAEDAPTSDITDMIRSLVQEEIQKISLNKSEPEVSSSSVEELKDATKAPVVEPESTNAVCSPDQSCADSPKEKIEQMFSDSDGSEDDSTGASSRSELRDHLKKAVRIAVRKSELDKLQEDLRESFISDAVMGAVGPRARNPIDRFSAEPAPRRSRRNMEEQPAAVEEKPAEEKAEESDVNLIDVTRQPVVKLTRLPFVKKRQMAKRGRVSG